MIAVSFSFFLLSCQVVVLLLYMSVIEIYTRGVLARSVAAGWWLIWAHQESLHPPVNLPLVYSASFLFSFLFLLCMPSRKEASRLSAGAFLLFFLSAQPLFSSLSRWFGLLSDSWNIGGSNTAGGLVASASAVFVFLPIFLFSFFFHDKSNQLASFIIYILI